MESGNQTVTIEEVLNIYENLYSSLEQHGFDVEKVPLFNGLGYKLESIGALKEREGITIDSKDVESAVARYAWILTPRD